MKIVKTVSLTMSLVVAAALLVGCSGGSSGGSTGSADEPITYKSIIVPEKTPDAKILIFGQSNAANSGIGSYTCDFEVLRTTNSYELVQAQNPIGGTGLAGSGSSFMPILADMLLESGKYESIEYANVAVAGTLIAEWLPGGELFERFEKLVEARGSDFTHILFHQGESDDHTSTQNYKSRFLTVLQGLRDLGITAPIYVAKTSRLNGKFNADIIIAQTQLSDEYTDIYPGPYTDVMGVEYRYDNNHFNEKGLIEHARLWNALIK